MCFPFLNTLCLNPELLTLSENSVRTFCQNFLSEHGGLQTTWAQYLDHVLTTTRLFNKRVYHFGLLLSCGALRVTNRSVHNRRGFLWSLAGRLLFCARYLHGHITFVRTSAANLHHYLPKCGSRKKTDLRGMRTHISLELQNTFCDSLILLSKPAQVFGLICRQPWGYSIMTPPASRQIIDYNRYLPCKTIQGCFTSQHVRLMGTLEMRLYPWHVSLDTPPE